MLFPMVPSRIVVEWFYFIPVNHPRPFEGTEVHEARRLELHLGMRTAVRMFDPISILSLMASGSVITWSILSQLQKARPLLFWRVLDQCTRKKNNLSENNLTSIKPTLTLQSNLRQLGSIKLRSALSPHPPMPSSELLSSWTCYVFGNVEQKFDELSSVYFKHAKIPLE